jgi:putative sigma-54 modulation protein
MKVTTQSVNFNADGKLLDFIQRRMDKLDLFYDKTIGADVYLKVVNTSAKENKIAEVKLHVPGDVFVVKKKCKTFEESVDSACESLERKLVKKKTKQTVLPSPKIL